ncbi:MAG: V-type ATP synthase subunit F [Bacilli bacterium]|jgi:vacuolar-type H+-ATPase subunit F/Vma7|nr:V-type ATP synthase subunit F [Bacilli bacterium]
MNKRVVAIARSENVFLFRSLGFQTFVINDEEMMKQAMEKIASEAQIIVIDEEMQTMIGDYRRRLSEKAFPIILALPIDKEASGQGLEKLRADVEKAIGLKLF